MSTTFYGNPDIAGLGFAGRELGEQGEHDTRTEGHGQKHCSSTRERVQTCEQKAAVLQGKAANSGRWKVLGIGEFKALCKSLNVLPVLFLLNYCSV